MNKSKIIFTADDYGVDETIDNGIIQLVKANIINSVEVLPNYGENGSLSLQNTLRLLDETKNHNSNLELGVHLTITSGKSISGDDGLDAILSNGYFHSAKRIKSTAKPEAIRNELIQQIDVLRNNPQVWSKVTHLTNHHDALWFYPEYTKVYVELAKDLNLPIRNPNVLPALKEFSYYSIIGPRKAGIKEINKSFQAYRLREKGWFEMCDLDYFSTHYLDSSHYSFWLTILNGDPYNVEKSAEKRMKALEKVFEQVSDLSKKRNSPHVVEVLFHVREGSSNNSKIKLGKEHLEERGEDAFDVHDLANYNGITTKYFDGRSTEFLSLFRARDSGLLEELFNKHDAESGKWSDCVRRELKKLKPA